METEPSPDPLLDFFMESPLFLHDIQDGSSLALSALSVLLLLLCSGLLSGSEVAYFSLNQQDLLELKEQDSDKSVRRILNLMSSPRYLLSTILIANNIINIAIIIVSDNLLSSLLPSELHTAYPYVHFGVTTIFVTFLLVLFGEVAPKVYATSNNMRIVNLMSSPLLMIRAVTKPLSWALVNSTKVIEHRLRARLAKKTFSQEDIASAIELTVKDSKYAEQDIDLLKSIVTFGNLAAKDVMCARMKVVAVDETITFEELIEVFKEEAFSRIPVFEDNIDQVKGVIHSKDLLPYIGQTDVKWTEKMRPPLFIPENKKIDDLFKDFQDKRTHMAIVVDEYGGTSGIVTMEDILEEIVGEIQDEFDDDQPEQNYKQINETTYEFAADTSLSDLCKTINVPADFYDEVREGADTIAGLILILNGTIPHINGKVTFKNHEFITLAATKRRIERVRFIFHVPSVENLES